MTAVAEAPPLLRPAHMWVPPHAVYTYGDRVAELADLVGCPPDPEQRLAIDAFSSVDRADRWAAFESAIIEGRQNGKTDGVVTPVVLDELYNGPPDEMFWTAHRFRTTRKSFRLIKAMIDGSADLSARTLSINEGRGEESIELHSGARLEFLARSKGAARGLGGKLIVFDEALYLDATMMGALLPTLSARQNTRIIYASSAGVGESDHLRTIRDRGRAVGDPSLVYLEWCTPEGGCQFAEECPHLVGTPGCKLDDESLWPLGNHAMVRGRITVEHVRNERRGMPPREFARERMGWWDPPSSGEHPIAVARWSALAKPRKRKPAGLTPTFFVQVSPDSTMSAIAVAYPAKRGPYVALADYRPGTSWLAKRCGVLATKFPDATWAVESTGAVGTELPALKAKDIEPDGFTSQDMGRACAHLQQLVADSAMSHSGDAAFSVSVTGAIRRPIGEGLWVFSPRLSSVDVSPLTAAAGALWAMESQDVEEDFAVVI